MEKSADQNNFKALEMTPKNIDDPVDANSSTNADDTDLQEVAAVNDSLDELTRALDFFEQRTDDIIAQLKVLLDSNREIRQQIAQDKEKEMISQDKENELIASLAASHIGNNKMACGDAEDKTNNVME